MSASCHVWMLVWFSWIFKISHWNTCGMVRASPVTWHNPIPAYGRLVELARPRPVFKNILGGIGLCHVTADARTIPQAFQWKILKTHENNFKIHENHKQKPWLCGIPQRSFPCGKRNAPEASCLDRLVSFLFYSSTKTNPTVSSYLVHFANWMKCVQKCQKMARARFMVPDLWLPQNPAHFLRNDPV